MTQASEHPLLQHQAVGTSFSGTYYVESAFVKKTVQNKDYTDFVLRDRSGARNVKYWGVVAGVSKGDWVFVAANVEEYQGNPSVVSKNVEKVDPPQDMSEYIPVYDDSGMYATRFDQIRTELSDLEKKIGVPIAGMIVDEVYGNSTFFSKFVVAPGSGRPHYGRQGGLLANTVRLAEGSFKMSDSYGLSDQERVILIASALLCRIGAIEAFEFKDCMPSVTKKGTLLGINNLTLSRITSAYKRVVEALKKEGQPIDQETVVRILHVVASYDSVAVKPMTKEAMVLNAVFEADSQIVDALDFIASDVNLSEEFTAYDPANRRKYYVGVRSV